MGEPGGGKTTLMLELLSDLIQDLIQTTEPQIPEPQIPVWLNLSSWSQFHSASKTQEPALEDWLLERLKLEYNILPSQASTWLNQQQVTLLLDGLDEVQADRRSECLVAIQQFHQSYGRTRIVVACRAKDFEDLQVVPNFDAAVYIKLLTRRQIEEYLIAAGDALSGLRNILHINDDLQKPDPNSLRRLVETPLLLNIIAITFEGKTAEDIRSIETENQKEVIFDKYIERMFKQRGLDICDPNDKKTLKWLHTLARSMGRETFLFVDQIQPRQWLKTLWLRSQYRILTAFLSGFLCGFIFFFNLFFFACLTNGNAISPEKPFSGWAGLSWGTVLVKLFLNSIAGIFGGIILGFLGGLVLALIFIIFGIIVCFIVCLFEFWLAKYLMLIRNNWAHNQVTKGFCLQDSDENVWSLASRLKLVVMRGESANKTLAEGVIRKLPKVLLASLLIDFLLIPDIHLGKSIGINKNVPYANLLAVLLMGSVVTILMGSVVTILAIILGSIIYFSTGSLSQAISASKAFCILLFLICFLALIITSIILLFLRSPSEIRISTTQHIRQSARTFSFIAFANLLLLGLSILLLICFSLMGYITPQAQGVLASIITLLFLFIVPLFVSFFSGRPLTDYTSLRIVIWINDLAPRNLSNFLDLVERNYAFLLKISGGYIFIHRLLMEHFADPTFAQRHGL